MTVDSRLLPNNWQSDVSPEEAWPMCKKRRPTYSRNENWRGNICRRVQETLFDKEIKTEIVEIPAFLCSLCFSRHFFVSKGQEVIYSQEYICNGLLCWPSCPLGLQGLERNAKASTTEDRLQVKARRRRRTRALAIIGSYTLALGHLFPAHIKVEKVKTLASQRERLKIDWRRYVEASILESQFPSTTSNW